MKEILPRHFATCVVAFAAFALAVSPLPADYIVAGPNSTLAPSSLVWAWDQTQLAPLRTALEDPANFGPAGVVSTSITTATLSAIDATTLAGVNAFVLPWWHDTDSAAYQADLLAFFFAGGDLFLFQDDLLVDGLGALLGVTSSNATGSISTAGPAGAPLFNGPFGTVAGVTQAGSLGQLNISATGARIGALNAESQITAAYWLPGEYAPGAGGLYILGDVDMLTGPQGGAVFPPDATANDKGRFGLNLFALAATQSAEPIPQVPEPATIILVASALALLVLRAPSSGLSRRCPDHRRRAGGGVACCARGQGASKAVLRKSGRPGQHRPQ